MPQKKPNTSYGRGMPRPYLPFTKLILVAFLLYCLLILVTSFTVFAVYRFYIPKKVAPYCANNSTSEVKIPPASPSALLDTSTWKTFTSPYGYTFKYPPIFELKTQSWQQQTQDGLITHEIDENTEAIIVYEDPIKFKGGGPPLYYTLWFKIFKPVNNAQELSSLQFAQQEFPKSEYGNEIQFQSLTIAGEAATKVSFMGEYLYIPHGQQMYQISYTPYSNLEYIITQILSTFEFLDGQTPTPTIPTGQLCGGFDGVPCPSGYTCLLDGSYPDASGQCVKN